MSASEAAVTAKLRNMVEDVERWPLSEQLLRALDELSDDPAAEPDEHHDAPAARTAKKA